MENNQQSKIIKFEDLKEQVLQSLNTNPERLGIKEPTTLVDGFVNSPLSTELSGAFVIGGPMVPMIMVVGNNSGRVYFFALKILIPDIDI